MKKERKITKSYIKLNKGITLIALVITIIVLLILAGVSITMLTGENGILKKAKEAQEKTKVAAEQEEKDLAKLNKWLIGEDDGIKVNFNGYTPNTWTNQDITINLLMEEEEGEKYQYSNDRSTWINCGATIKINQDQDKIYYFRRIDANGSSIYETQGFEVKRDTEKPTFDVDFSSESDSITCKLTNIKDIGSGLGDNPQISISYRKPSDTEYVNAYTGTGSEYTITGIGQNVSYVIKISVTDIAGNKTNIIKKIETKTRGEVRADGYIVNLSFDYDYWSEDWLEILYSDNYSLEDMINKRLEEEDDDEYKIVANLETLEKCEGREPVTSFFELVPNETAEKTEDSLYRVPLTVESLNDTYCVLAYNLSEEVFTIISPEEIDFENHILTFCAEDLSAISILRDVE